MKGRYAVAQIKGADDISLIYDKIEAFVIRAKMEHADLILFPETIDRWGNTDNAQDLNGSFLKKMTILARREKIWVIFGMREKAEDKVYNTVVVLNSDGEAVKTYHKTHLYDAFGMKESDTYLAGDNLFEPIDTPYGKIGLFVCYEVRFPEIARYEALKGAQILLMPTAWIEGTRKREQFQILACARALENTCYLLTANLCDDACTGNSMIIDPLGEILQRADKEETVLFADIDTDMITEIRNMVPSLKNRRDEVYKL